MVIWVELWKNSYQKGNKQVIGLKLKSKIIMMNNIMEKFKLELPDRLSRLYLILDHQIYGFQVKNVPMKLVKLEISTMQLLVLLIKLIILILK